MRSDCTAAYIEVSGFRYLPPQPPARLTFFWTLLVSSTPWVVMTQLNLECKRSCISKFCALQPVSSYPKRSCSTDKRLQVDRRNMFFRMGLGSLTALASRKSSHTTRNSSTACCASPSLQDNAPIKHTGGCRYHKHRITRNAAMVTTISPKACAWSSSTMTCSSRSATLAAELTNTNWHNRKASCDRNTWNTERMCAAKPPQTCSRNHNFELPTSRSSLEALVCQSCATPPTVEIIASKRRLSSLPRTSMAITTAFAPQLRSALSSKP
mmetsp:Transcript_69734/g.136865  ORF Transcript_69734/g.136865 Transcript_69734/m.136865 type:complete len:268 (-) Transcript_69734:1399-2202(-)